MKTKWEKKNKTKQNEVYIKNYTAKNRPTRWKKLYALKCVSSTFGVQSMLYTMHTVPYTLWTNCEHLCVNIVWLLNERINYNILNRVTCCGYGFILINSLNLWFLLLLLLPLLLSLSGTFVINFAVFFTHSLIWHIGTAYSYLNGLELIFIYIHKYDM